MTKQISYIWKSFELKMQNKKLVLFFVMIFVIAWRYSGPLRAFSAAVDYPVSWCLFPFLMCSFTFLIFFWFGIIYVNSDAPFMQAVNMYHVLRTGRKTWAAGQIGGIILRSFITTTGVIVCSLLPVINRLDLSGGWGKLLHTAAMTNAAQLYRFEYVFFYQALVKFTPLQLMLLCALITSLCSAFIGLLMFLISLYASRALAVAGATGFSLALFLVLNTTSASRQKLAFFIPTIWPEVARVYTPEYGYYWMPSIRYMLICLFVSIAIFSGMILHKISSVEFRWENEDM